MVSENLRPLKENERLACNKCFKDHGNYCLESLDDIEIPDDFLHNCLTLKSLMQIQSLKEELELSRDRYIATQEEFVAPLEFEILEINKKLSQYESGHKGACSTCEVVGELNVELEKRLEGAIEVIEIYSKGVGSSSAIRWLNQNNQTKGGE